MQDICKIGVNGAIFKCPGVTDGQFIIYFPDNAQFMLCLILASNPDLEFIEGIFSELVEEKFPQYIHIPPYHFLFWYPIFATRIIILKDISFGEDKLCGRCVQLCFAQNALAVDEIKDISPNNKVSIFFFPYNPSRFSILTSFSKNCAVHAGEAIRYENAMREICWTHSQDKHDFFINYRVATEGNAGLRQVYYTQDKNLNFN